MKKYLFIILLVGVCFGQEVKEKYNKKYLNAVGYSSDKKVQELAKEVYLFTQSLDDYLSKNNIN